MSAARDLRPVHAGESGDHAHGAPALSGRGPQSAPSHSWVNLTTDALHRRPPARLGARGYFLHALAHPANVSLVVSAVSVAMIVGALWAVPLVGALELLALGGVSRWSIFREAVEQGQSEAHRLSRRRIRRHLAANLRYEHRMELDHLEQLVAFVRGAPTEQLELDLIDLGLDLDDLDDLLDDYVELATRARRCRQSLEELDERVLEQSISYREQECNQLEGSEARRVAERRIKVLRRRLEHRHTVARLQQWIAQKLALISEVVRMVYERACVPVALQSAPALTERLVSSVDALAATDDDELVAFFAPSESAVAGAARS